MKTKHIIPTVVLLPLAVVVILDALPYFLDTFDAKLNHGFPGIHYGQPEVPGQTDLEPPYKTL